MFDHHYELGTPMKKLSNVGDMGQNFRALAVRHSDSVKLVFHRLDNGPVKIYFYLPGGPECWLEILKPQYVRIPEGRRTQANAINAFLVEAGVGEGRADGTLVSID